MSAANDWSRRFSLMYAVGVWTVLGYFASRSLHYTETPKKKEEDNRKNSTTVLEKQKIETEEQKNEEVIYKSSTTGFEITERKINSSDFVPFPTRLYNSVLSLFNYNIKK